MESLLERCFQSPLASKVSGGITVSTASEGASSPFPAGMYVLFMRGETLLKKKAAQFLL